MGIEENGKIDMPMPEPQLHVLSSQECTEALRGRILVTTFADRISAYQVTQDGTLRINPIFELNGSSSYLLVDSMSVLCGEVDSETLQQTAFQLMADEFDVDVTRENWIKEYTDSFGIRVVQRNFFTNVPGLLIRESRDFEDEASEPSITRWESIFVDEHVKELMDDILGTRVRDSEFDLAKAAIEIAEELWPDV